MTGKVTLSRKGLSEQTALALATREHDHGSATTIPKVLRHSIGQRDHLTRKTVLSGKSAQETNSIRRSERLAKKTDVLEPTVKEKPAGDVVELTDEESLASQDNLLSTDRRKGNDDGTDKEKPGPNVIELTDGSSAGEHASQDTLPSVGWLLESHRKWTAEGKSSDDAIELRDKSYLRHTPWD
ncbi:hypothetical protein AGABI2DRAFT_142243 [Agaricus bisporus var. bisporus H97]|uniref:hypothetical protein n=1 Tax=Agaricus bisporus var. bisporus (strain H97 / ATCC MYA-4626 / FGSC 10389) TaxID=936046 RepID=UPI00029F6F7F|nr:hypothetical protein AGABI2DRAFT_142243 [Agaricus bisporus var. bisporus H97]EKV47964.1 hypothetical protein AGABI2DRAFT_142243 [Agaricus bisporus var. bisporus H97]